MIAVKYSDGSYYPEWWIIDSISGVEEAPDGYVLKTEEEYQQYLIDTESDRSLFLGEKKLRTAKDLKKAEIDINTQGLIAKGFTYANLTWSLSLTAQINWTNLNFLPAEMFPLPIQSQEEQLFMLPLLERPLFYAAALTAKNTALQSGSVLKAQIEALLTVEEVHNFQDNRI